jgi:hypothetical protein
MLQQSLAGRSVADSAPAHDVLGCQGNADKLPLERVVLLSMHVAAHMHVRCTSPTTVSGRW